MFFSHGTVDGPPLLVLSSLKMKINQHVVKRSNGWAVLGEGNGRDTIVLPTQAAAVQRAREIAHNQGRELSIHARNGRIREKDTNGSDPCPPYDGNYSRTTAER